MFRSETAQHALTFGPAFHCKSSLAMLQSLTAAVGFPLQSGLNFRLSSLVETFQKQTQKYIIKLSIK